MQMDVGNVTTAFDSPDVQAALFADEATDRHDNSGFDLIGTLGNVTDNASLLEALSPKNLTVRATIDLRQAQMVDSEDKVSDQKRGLFESVSDLAQSGLSGTLSSEWDNSARSDPVWLLPAGFAEEQSPSVAHKLIDQVSTSAASGGEANPAIDITGSVGIVSDYRFRGLSLSGLDPAVQASLELSDDAGFYVGTWASSIKNAPSDVELDVYSGWRGKTGPFDLDVGAVAYVYPGGSDWDYIEFAASAAFTIGPAEVKLGTAYAPKQDNLGQDDNLYAYGDLELAVPDTPVNLLAHLGVEQGALAGPTGRKWDWSLGAEVVIDHFSLGLSYVDTSIDRRLDPARLSGSGVLASFKFEF